MQMYPQLRMPKYRHLMITMYMYTKHQAINPFAAMTSLEND